MSLTVSKAIKIIREAKGVSLKALADCAQISVPYLSLVESEKRSPSVDVLRRISEALETPLDVFLSIGSGANSSLFTNDIKIDRMVSFLNQMQSVEKKLKDMLNEHECQKNS